MYYQVQTCRFHVQNITVSSKTPHHFHPGSANSGVWWRPVFGEAMSNRLQQETWNKWYCISHYMSTQALSNIVTTEICTFHKTKSQEKNCPLTFCFLFFLLRHKKQVGNLWSSWKKRTLWSLLQTTGVLLLQGSWWPRRQDPWDYHFVGGYFAWQTLGSCDILLYTTLLSRRYVQMYIQYIYIYYINKFLNEVHKQTTGAQMQVS